MTDARETTKPSPAPQRKPRALLLLLQIQAIWLITASAGRVLIMITQHTPLDPLPFISFALGVLSIFIVTSWSHRR